MRRLDEIGGPSARVVCSLDIGEVSELPSSTVMKYLASHDDLVVTRLMLDAFEDDVRRFGAQIRTMVDGESVEDATRLLVNAVVDARRSRTYLVVLH